jgi:hypothetical protein
MWGSGAVTLSLALPLNNWLRLVWLAPDALAPPLQVLLAIPVPSSGNGARPLPEVCFGSFLVDLHNAFQILPKMGQAVEAVDKLAHTLVVERRCRHHRAPWPGSEPPPTAHTLPCTS